MWRRKVGRGGHVDLCTGQVMMSRCWWAGVVHVQQCHQILMSGLRHGAIAPQCRASGCAGATSGPRHGRLSLGIFFVFPFLSLILRLGRQYLLGHQDEPRRPLIQPPVIFISFSDRPGHDSPTEAGPSRRAAQVLLHVVCRRRAPLVSRVSLQPKPLEPAL